MTATGESDEPVDVLDFEGFPGRWEILESRREGEYRFRTRMVIDDASELPPHAHPSATERYEVVRGTFEVHAGGEWRRLGPGESHTVPPGTTHTFRTTGPVEVLNVHDPAMRFESFFRRFHRFKTEQDVAMPPSGLRLRVLLAMLLTEYEAEFRARHPPHWVFRLLARVGRALGVELPD